MDLEQRIANLNPNLISHEKMKIIYDENNGKEWIKIYELPTSKYIRNFKIKKEPDDTFLSGAFKLEMSDDKINWTTIMEDYSPRNIDRYEETIIHGQSYGFYFVSRKAKYIRTIGECEFDVYEDLEMLKNEELEELYKHLQFEIKEMEEMREENNLLNSLEKNKNIIKEKNNEILSLLSKINKEKRINQTNTIAIIFIFLLIISRWIFK